MNSQQFKGSLPIESKGAYQTYVTEMCPCGCGRVIHTDLSPIVLNFETSLASILTLPSMLEADLNVKAMATPLSLN